MYLLIILLSYLLGCASTIALLIYLYTRYALFPTATPNEENDEQYEPFHPLPDTERAKNSAVDTVNYIFQFLFQELKDSSRLRRYLMHKLNTEFQELRNSRTGKIFLQNILIEKFSIGNRCPVFSDIQLERQERDERNRIKEFMAKLDANYEDGFSVTLDVTLLFGQKCQIFIKVKRIQGHLRLEFRREPFSHWLLVFQDEPTIDFEVKSYFATVERPQLAQIITQQLRRAIKRKQTWPSYKIRYQPFFPTAKPSIPTEILSANQTNLIPGRFDIIIKYCDRLSIPLAIYDKQKIPSVTVFLTINTNEQSCANFLHIQRETWPTKEIELQRNVHKILIKEVTYMDRTELLIEDIEPIPAPPEEIPAFKTLLEDRNMFLLKIQGQEVKTLKQAYRLLKQKILTASTDPSAPTTTATNDDRFPLVIGLPVLHSVRLQRVIETTVINTDEATARPDVSSPSLSQTLRHRTVTPTVKFEKGGNSVAVNSKSADGDEESVQDVTITDTSAKIAESNANKKAKLTKNATVEMTLIMMNADVLSGFQAQPTPPKKSDTFIEFNDEFQFQVTPKERFLNICLWCKPPLDCDVPQVGKKLILLGYATTALSELVLDAHMSFKRETQMTLNFCSAYSPKTNLNAILTESESKKRLELSAHKGYDDNLAHGFVTINVKHQPDNEKQLTSQEKKDQFLANGPLLTEICAKLKEEERKEQQRKYINVINAQQELLSRKPTDHLFEDKSFTVATLCDCCHKKIWMKVGRQCRDCLTTIHKKCEEKFNAENHCTHEPIAQKTNLISPVADDDSKSLLHVDLNNSENPVIITTEEGDSGSIKTNYDIAPTSLMLRTTTPTTANRLTTKAAAAFSVLDSTARRSFRAFGHKNPVLSASATPTLATTSELSKSDESLSQISTTSSNVSTSTKSSLLNQTSAQASSKIANAASSAYSKLREFKSKRLPVTSADAQTLKKPHSSSELKQNENISESDLRVAISSYLADESNDMKGLEDFLQAKASDDTVLYAKANEFGPELFRELSPEERKQRLDGEISRLQQEIDLQCQIRDEMIRECDQSSIDENEKRKIRSRIANINEKIQALSALTILYCSGLKHCCTQMEPKETVNNSTTISETSQLTPDENEENLFDDPLNFSENDDEDDDEEDDDDEYEITEQS